jgi:hypothetical protein
VWRQPLRRSLVFSLPTPRRRRCCCRPLAYGDKANPIILTADGWEEMSEVEDAEVEEAASLSVYDNFVSGWDEEEEEEVGDEF